MKNTKQKWTRTLAIAMVALQIPLFMLWDITYNTVYAASQRLVNVDGVFRMEFGWDLFGKAILMYLPVILALVICLVLPVVGMIRILRGKGTSIPTICFYAVTVVAAGYLCLAFTDSSFIGGTSTPGMMLQEFMFFRYFAGMDLPISAEIFSRLQSIKYVFLGLLMAGSGVLCGLGIAGLAGKQKEPSVADGTETEPQNE